MLIFSWNHSLCTMRSGMPLGEYMYLSFCAFYSVVYTFLEKATHTKHPRLHWNYLFNPVGFVSLQVNSCSYHSFLYFTYSTKIDIEQLLLSVYYKTYLFDLLTKLNYGIYSKIHCHSNI